MLILLYETRADRGLSLNWVWLLFFLWYKKLYWAAYERKLEKWFDVKIVYGSGRESRYDLTFKKIFFAYGLIMGNRRIFAMRPRRTENFAYASDRRISGRVARDRPAAFSAFCTKSRNGSCAFWRKNHLCKMTKKRPPFWAASFIAWLYKFSWLLPWFRRAYVRNKIYRFG